MENTERNENNGKERPKRSFNFYWIYGIIGVVILSMCLFNYGPKTQPIDVSEYEQILDAGDVDRIVMVNEQQVDGATSRRTAFRRSPTRTLSRTLSGQEHEGPPLRSSTSGQSDHAEGPSGGRC